MKRLLASKRPFGPVLSVGENVTETTEQDSLLVIFEFIERDETTTRTTYFDFDEQDPGNLIEDEIKESIESVFTEAELNHLKTQNEQLIYKVPETVLNDDISAHLVVWNRTDLKFPNSNIEEVNQTIEENAFASTPKLETVTVAKSR